MENTSYTADYSPSYFHVSNKAENILFMIKFMNYAYNMPDSEQDVPMGNDEKTGGQFLFFHIINEMESLNKDIQELMKKA